MFGVVSTFVECKRDPDGGYEFFCGCCKKSCGTTTAMWLLSAAMNMRSKGGIMCPDCREQACPGCGAIRMDGHLCQLCIWEIESIYDCILIDTI